MSSRWPLVPLAEVLTQDRSYIDRPEGRLYPKLSVKLYGKGVVIDASADGMALRMQRHQLAKAGQVILSEIWGKKGAVGIVPPEGKGALCTSHFFLFDVDRDRVHPGYLQAVFSSNYLESQLGSEAKGTTGYAAVRPQHLLAARIPLPPLPDQLRIVTRVERISAGVAEALNLRQAADVGADLLLSLMAHRPDLDSEAKRQEGWIEISLGDITRQSQDRCRVAPDGGYPNLGIYSFGRGLFEKPAIEGARTSALELYRVRAGQFIYSRLFAFEGAYGLVSPEFDGYFVSAEYPTFDCDAQRAFPEFLEAYFRFPPIWPEVAAGSKGLGDRRQRVQPAKLLSHRLMLPPLQEQEGIRMAKAVLETLRPLRSQTKTELEAVASAMFEGVLGNHK